MDKKYYRDEGIQKVREKKVDLHIHMVTSPFTTIPFSLPIEQRRYTPSKNKITEGSFPFNSPNLRILHLFRVFGFSILPVSSPIILGFLHINLHGEPGYQLLVRQTGKLSFDILVSGKKRWFIDGNA